jgi:1-acyl-sn-glycerol-3-phosphate acyltransferase
MMGGVRVVATIVVLFVVTIVMYPVQWLAIWRNWPLAARLPWYWQRLACFMAGVTVHVEGTPAVAPLLIAANHVSWLDITVIGSVMPVSFVAKVEVARWPVVGTLARLQRSVFIDRTRRSQTAEATAAIASRVGRGDVVVLFAEGTTGDGNRMLPFRSALLGAAQAAANACGSITVQPMAIAYSAIHGIPIGHADRPTVAWYGDMKLGGHFFRLIGLGALDVVVRFGKPLPLAPGDDRKKVAAECFEDVRLMIDDIRRRPMPLGSRGPVFSGPAKGSKGAAGAAPEGVRARPPEEVASRVS